MSSDLHFQIKLRSRIGFLNVSRIELKFSHFFTTSYGQKNKEGKKIKKRSKSKETRCICTSSSSWALLPLHIFLLHVACFSACNSYIASYQYFYRNDAKSCPIFLRFSYSFGRSLESPPALRRENPFEFVQGRSSKGHNTRQQQIAAIRQMHCKTRVQGYLSTIL